MRQSIMVTLSKGLANSSLSRLTASRPQDFCEASKFWNGNVKKRTPSLLFTTLPKQSDPCHTDTDYLPLPSMHGRIFRKLDISSKASKSDEVKSYNFTRLAGVKTSHNHSRLAGVKPMATLRTLDIERPLCPGCGIDMQDNNPEAPGYFVRPTPKELPDDVLDQLTLEEMAAMESATVEENQRKKKEEDKWVVFRPEGGKLVPVGEVDAFSTPENAGEKEEEELLLSGFSPAGLEFGNLDAIGGDSREQLEAWSRLWDEEEVMGEGGSEGRSGRRGGNGEIEEDKEEGAETSNKAIVCARCHALRHYGRVKDNRLENLLPDFDFDRVVGARLRKAYGRRSVVMMVIDTADFDGSFPRKAAEVLSQVEEMIGGDWKEGLPGNNFRLLVVANKIDLLPKQVSMIRLEQWVRRRARAGGAPRVSGVFLVSAQTGKGVKELTEKLEQLAGARGDVWVIGAQNAGKSSLINALSRAKLGSKKTELTEASLPGTTIGVIPLEGLLGGRARVLDTPGLLHPHQITTRLTREEQKLVQPRKHLKPRTFRVKTGTSILIGGLARVDVVEAPGESLYLTVWVSGYMMCHMGKEENAEAVIKKHVGTKLQPPCEGERILELGEWLPRIITVDGTRWDQSSMDVVIAGLGWVAVGVKGVCKLRVWTYEDVAVTVREAMVFDMATVFEKAGFTAGKLPALKEKSSKKYKKDDSEVFETDALYR